MQALLDALGRASLRREVEAFVGYDMRIAGDCRVEKVHANLKRYRESGDRRSR